MILILPTCIREYWESEIKISWPRRYSSLGFFFALLGQQFSHCILLTLIFIFLYCQLLESERCSVVSDSWPPPGLIVHRILQARILEWVAFPFSRERRKGPSQPRDWTQVAHIAGDSLPIELSGKPSITCLKNSNIKKLCFSWKMKWQ